MLKAFALAAERAVPEVRKRSVRVLRLGVSVKEGCRSAGTGYKEYEAIAVSTTRTESRGFESERSIERVRWIEWMGRREERVESVDEASGGRPSSAAPGTVSVFAAACRTFCRRRCGRSFVRFDALGVVVSRPEPPRALDTPPPLFAAYSGPADVKVPLPELARGFSCRALAEKYPDRNRGLPPTTALLISNVCENSRVAV
jgi:hypothetical protein